MKKKLRKTQNRNQKTLQQFSQCPCSCSGCGSVPSNDYVNVYTNGEMKVDYSHS